MAASVSRQSPSLPFDQSRIRHSVVAFEIQINGKFYKVRVKGQKENLALDQLSAKVTNLAVAILQKTPHSDSQSLKKMVISRYSAQVSFKETSSLVKLGQIQLPVENSLSPLSVSGSEYFDSIMDPSNKKLQDHDNQQDLISVPISAFTPSPAKIKVMQVTDQEEVHQIKEENPLSSLARGFWGILRSPIY